MSGYKQTDIGVIPEDWEVRKIKHLCKLVNGRGFKPHEWSVRGHPIIRIQNLNGSEEFNYFAGTFDRKILVEHGQLLFAWSGSRGTSFGPHVWRGETAVLNYHTWKVNVATSEVDADYFYYALRHLTEFIEENAHGASALVHTQKWEMEGFEVAVPKRMAEQRAIAEALSDAGASIAIQSRLISKKRDLRRGVMQRLLTGRTRLPGFAAPWQEKRLGDHVAFLKNGAHSRAQLTVDGPVRYLHYGDIHVSADLCLDLRRASMPSLSSLAAAGLTRLQDGDVVFVDASEDLDGVGKSLEILGAEGIEAVAGQHTIAARFDKSVLSDGFKRYLQFLPSFRAHLRRLAAGTKVYATHRKHIGSAEVVIPEPEEQRAIANVLSDMETEITALEGRLEKTRSLKQAMMQALLTGRVRLPSSRKAAPKRKEAAYA